jgi:hypothetical protein
MRFERCRATVVSAVVRHVRSPSSRSRIVPYREIAHSSVNATGTSVMRESAVDETCAEEKSAS